LVRIKSAAFRDCSSFESITVARHVQILCSSCFCVANRFHQFIWSRFRVDEAEMRIEEYMVWPENGNRQEKAEEKARTRDGHDDDEFEPEDGLEDTNFLIDPGFIREVEDENELDEGERMRRRREKEIVERSDEGDGRELDVMHLSWWMPNLSHIRENHTEYHHFIFPIWISRTESQVGGDWWR
jgi:hypothetical protein